MTWHRTLATLGLAWFAAAAAPLHAAEDISKAKSDVNSITKKLNDLDVWFSDATRRQRDLQQELRSTDQSIAGTSSDIRDIEAELKRIGAELADLNAQMQTLTAQRQQQAELIANHLAAAYRLTGEDFLKLLLNQQDPDQLDRMMHYHRYFAQARSDAIDAYKKTLAEIAANAAATQQREQALAQQQRNLDAERDELRSKRQGRERLLASLKTEMQGKADERARLTEDRKRLESLITELQRRAQRGEVASGAFARAKGKLPWPTAGKVAHRFGQDRSGGLLKWQGIFIDAPEGTPVTAVHSGRIAYSDWFRGFGLLTIIDHGNGFMSLYAHSDVLYKQIGDTVTAGETIATTGRSGGQTESGLYFEIRSNGTAIDPLVWLSRR
ncbi:MAG TPA: peptidoglycan DD-metalloendopeptidase family protein [Pseudomonadales bacterium]|nr:peptidoglycan DD-metalloendopeptidase family protein [Pseudomonadales bacterium]